MVEQSSKNFHKAEDYYAEKLNAERNAFYDLFLNEKNCRAVNKNN